jgi:hypothetical protein
LLEPRKGVKVFRTAMSGFVTSSAFYNDVPLPA